MNRQIESTSNQALGESGDSLLAKQELVGRVIEGLSREYSLVLLDLVGVMDINGIKNVLIFGPGLSDVEAFLEALRSVQTTYSRLEKVTCVDIDKRIIEGLRSRKKQYPFLDICEETFSSFLDKTQLIDTDIILVNNTGPATTDELVGVHKGNVGGMVDTLRSNGVIITGGETMHLGELLDSTEGIKNLGETIYSLKDGGCWQKTN